MRANSVALAIATAVLAAGGSVAGAATFGPAADLSGPTVADLDVGMAENGEAIALWDRVTPRTDAAVEVATHRRGAPWSAPLRLSGAGFALFPRLAVAPSGDAVAIWQMEGGPIVAATRRATGTWEAPVVLDASGREPDVATDTRGDLQAIWVHTGDDGSSLRTASHPLGGAWSAPIVVAQDPDPFTLGRAGVSIDDAGAAVASWERGAGTGHEIHAEVYVASRRDGAWGVPVRLAAFGARVGEAMDEAGTATVVWNDFTALRSVSQTAGGIWPAPMTIADLGAAGDLVRDSRRLSLFLAVPVQGSERLMIATRAVWPPSPATSWAFAPFPDTGAGNVRDLALAAAPIGKAVAAWVLGTPAGWLLKAARRNPAGHWQAPEVAVPARPVGSIAGVRAATDSRGDTVIVWQRSTATGDVAAGVTS
jgi:hypothetical protein